MGPFRNHQVPVDRFDELHPRLVTEAPPLYERFPAGSYSRHGPKRQHAAERSPLPPRLIMLLTGPVVGLFRRLRGYFRYYHGSRTHLALEKDAPETRAVEPPEHGAVVAVPQVGGLHHRYIRRAA